MMCKAKAWVLALTAGLLLAGSAGAEASLSYNGVVVAGEPHRRARM